jgi:hypothetical protein
MAEEGTPHKKPRHEDSNLESDQNAGSTDPNSNVLTHSNTISLPQEASSQGKKRPASELDNVDRVLVPQKNNPILEEQDVHSSNEEPEPECPLCT